MPAPAADEILNPSSALAILCCAMIALPTFLSLRDALYFLSDLREASSCFVEAPPHTQGCSSTCLAVSLFFGFSSRRAVTSDFASFEMSSHHGDGKSYLRRDGARVGIGAEAERHHRRRGTGL